jgi:hypothetical protein
LNKYRPGLQEIEGSSFAELLSGGTKAMKVSYVTTTFLAVTAFSNVLSSDHSDPQLISGRQMSTSAPNVIAGLASMPLAFTQNQGQWAYSILFRANAGGATTWFSKGGAYLSVHPPHSQ